MGFNRGHCGVRVAALERVPVIYTLGTISGRSDMLAMGSAPATVEIDRVLDEVGSLRGVARTEAAIILSTKFERR